MEEKNINSEPMNWFVQTRKNWNAFFSIIREAKEVIKLKLETTCNKLDGDEYPESTQKMNERK